jgi:hypothetical protein
MPTGAGLSPAGSSICGYGLYDAANIPNPQALPDYVTNLQQTGRFLNADTGDYAATPDGRLQGMSTAQQVVTLALTTVLNSSAVSGLGQTFTSIKEKGDSFQKQMSACIVSALSGAVKANLIQILKVTVLQPPSNPDAGIAHVRWIDITTGVEQTSQIGGSS